MTTKQLLPPGSDKDFAVVHSTLTDSKVTAELLAATDRSGSKYRIPLLGEARRIGHTLNTLDRIKARHDALVSVLEDIEWAGEGRTCPECDRCNGVVDEERGHENCVNTGHRDDCQLAAALEAAK